MDFLGARLSSRGRLQVQHERHRSSLGHCFLQQIDVTLHLGTDEGPVHRGEYPYVPREEPVDRPVGLDGVGQASQGNCVRMLIRRSAGRNGRDSSSSSKNLKHSLGVT